MTKNLPIPSYRNYAEPYASRLHAYFNFLGNTANAQHIKASSPSELQKTFDKYAGRLILSRIPHPTGTLYNFSFLNGDGTLYSKLSPTSPEYTVKLNTDSEFFVFEGSSDLSFDSALAYSQNLQARLKLILDNAKRGLKFEMLREGTFPESADVYLYANNSHGWFDLIYGTEVYQESHREVEGFKLENDYLEPYMPSSIDISKISRRLTEYEMLHG